MKIKLFLLIIMIFTIKASVHSQNNAPMAYGKYFQLQSSQLMPSKLGSDPNSSSVSVNVLNVYSWAENNALTAKDLIKAASGQISTSEANNLVSALKAKTNIGFAYHIQPIAFAVKIHKKTDGFHSDNPDLANYPTRYKEELFTFSFEWNERVEGNLFFSNQLAQLAWYGNKRFEGQTLSIGNTGFNGSWNREFVLGFAMPLPIFYNEDLKLRLGARFKYIQTIVGATTSKANGDFTTGTLAQGYPLSFNLDYQFNYAGIQEGQDFNPSSIAGRGFGMDLGATFSYQDRFVGTLSILDIGGVRLKNNVYNYNSNGQASFNGITIDPANTTGTVNISDTLINKINSTVTNNSFRMGLPTRLSFQAEYKIKGKTAKGIEYDKHTFFLTYTQGFVNRNIAITKPQLSLAYSFDLNRNLNVGASMAFGGYNTFAMGSFLATRAGSFRFGVGSSSIWSYFISGKGIDFSFNLGFGF